jgi:hypothetical protein
MKLSKTLRNPGTIILILIIETIILMTVVY